VRPRGELLATMQAFDRGLRERAATRRTALPFGTAIFCDDLPRVWDLNAVFAHGSLVAQDADALIGAVDQVQGGAGLAHRRVLLADEPSAWAVLPRLAALGWAHAWWSYMTHSRPPDRPLAAGLAREVDGQVARQVERRAMGEDPELSEEGVAAQLLAGRERLAAFTDARFFVGAADGVDASVCTLYFDGAVAQIEDVVALRAYRGRGLGRAVVHAALDAALAAGHDVVFIVADDADWPKRLYRKLGFEPVGRALNLVRSRV
jgi:ribosomal protein S18 acetylase RimI-like enzyme